jgi:RimJ/RimL family protein N-acetyltransferase
MRVQSKSLDLVLMTRDELLAAVETMRPEERAQVSPDWLARVRASQSDDVWLHGFSLVHRETGAAVGRCGFKGPPVNGVVEIAYGIEPEHRCKGYATEAADAMTRFAFDSGAVRVVCAHTLPEESASTHVLTKCGFRNVGAVIDPEDGLVWRWEKYAEAPPSPA